jgi:hypothetical protein
MSRAWTGEQLDKIGNAEELDLASMRADGTLRRPVPMWVVRHGDDLCVRSVNGRGSSWFRGAQGRREARIEAGGVAVDVALVEVDDLNDELDADYRQKYGHYAGPTARITSDEARAAALRLVPREEKN